jgi:hypothetical protein
VPVSRFVHVRSIAPSVQAESRTIARHSPAGVELWVGACIMWRTNAAGFRGGENTLSGGRAFPIQETRLGASASAERCILGRFYGSQANYPAWPASESADRAGWR